MEKDQFTNIHLDILKEIGNIGAGHAATALSTLLNKKIDMKIPNVRIVPFNEIMELAGGSENVVVSVFLRIEGDANGNMFFILPIEQGERFIKQMIGDPTFTFASPISEIGVSAAQELGNILAGSYLTALSDFTQLDLLPSVPALSVDMFGAIISYGLLEVSQISDHAIVVDTALYEADSLSAVNGHFFLLPNPESFQIIFKSLGVE
ncbi:MULTISPECIES: chemotaxis protein CheC [Heyndrickxia]|uniref:chemotaxis protein CheC n=1 Tax=Heyndrickxia TaxID=2837504 RepID=UPI002E22C511|nr:chemotaxis protein CheC [Heyndrickxia sporothermodurans]